MEKYSMYQTDFINFNLSLRQFLTHLNCMLKLPPLNAVIQLFFQLTLAKIITIIILLLWGIQHHDISLALC